MLTVQWRFVLPKSKEDAIVLEGTVTEALPNAIFSVELENGHEVLAHLREDAHALHPILPGDRVQVELTPYDLSEVASPIGTSRGPVKVRPSVKKICEKCKVIRRTAASG